MMRQGPMTPTVYVETSESRLNPQTIVKVVWDESHVERTSFATLAEALEFAHRLCDPEDDASPLPSPERLKSHSLGTTAFQKLAAPAANDRKHGKVAKRFRRKSLKRG